ncbi:MAG: hypothetical protein PVJ21_20475, partial [Anaerolineales bacterium]
AKDVEAALERNLYVDAEKITVKVETGRRALTGSVSTFYAQGGEHDADAFIAGVINMDDNIVVN